MQLWNKTDIFFIVILYVLNIVIKSFHSVLCLTWWWLTQWQVVWSCKPSWQKQWQGNRLTLTPTSAMKEIPSVTWKSPTYKKRCHVPGDSGAIELCFGLIQKKRNHNQTKNMQPACMKALRRRVTYPPVLKAVFYFHAFPLYDWYNR